MAVLREVEAPASGLLAASTRPSGVAQRNSLNALFSICAESNIWRRALRDGGGLTVAALPMAASVRITSKTTDLEVFGDGPGDLRVGPHLPLLALPGPAKKVNAWRKKGDKDEEARARSVFRIPIEARSLCITPYLNALKK